MSFLLDGQIKHGLRFHALKAKVLVKGLRIFANLIGPDTESRHFLFASPIPGGLNQTRSDAVPPMLLSDDKAADLCKRLGHQPLDKANVKPASDGSVEFGNENGTRLMKEFGNAHCHFRFGGVIPRFDREPRDC